MRGVIVVGDVTWTAIAVGQGVPSAGVAGSDATKTVLGRLRTDPVAISWWGLRPVPYRVGGRYLDVASVHNPARSLGSVIGVITEQLRSAGVSITRVVVPADRARLYGQEPGLAIVNVDGVEDRTTWRPLANDASEFTDVPVVKRDFDPVLTKSQYEQVLAKTHLIRRTSSVYVGTAEAGESGTWVVLARETPTGRRFLIVPIEVSPLGGDS